MYTIYNVLVLDINVIDNFVFLISGKVINASPAFYVVVVSYYASKT